MTKILVAYASKHDSTAEIANAIGEALGLTQGLEVDICAVEAVVDVDSYDAIVLGSAVYAGQWQPSAAEFLKEYLDILVRRPVWLFSSGPTGEGDPRTLLKGWEFPEALKQLAEYIHPRDIAVFSGKLAPEDLGFFERTIVKMVKAPTGDFRDWKMIRQWATEIAQALVPA